MSKITVTTIAGLTSGGDANKVKIDPSNTLHVPGHASIGVDAVDASRGLTVAGATDGSGSSALVVYNSSLASKFSVRDDGLTTITNNATVGGTFAVTGNSTANSINLGGRSLGAGGTPLGVNFSSASTNGMQINDTNSGNLGGFMGFYSGSGAGTLRANIQNANNAGMHLCLGTSGTVSFGSTGYVAANALDEYEEGPWPATLGGSGSDPTVSSYSYNSGHYTKIGRQVFAHIYMRIEAGGISGGSGDGIIKGLPFAAKSTGNISNGVGGWIENYWSTSTSFSSGRNYPMLYLAAGSNYIGIWQKGTNNPTQMTAWALSQIDDAAFLVGGVLVYMVA